MRFVTFKLAGEYDGQEREARFRAGVLVGDGAGLDDWICDLGHASMRAALSSDSADVERFVRSDLRRIADRIEARGLQAEARIPLESATLAAPIPRPRRIFGIAHNFRCALAERGMKPPDAPVLFMKEPHTIVGCHAPIVLPRGVGGVTYEAELAAVIGRGGMAITEKEALSHVAGYAAFNDISASDMIRQDGRFDRGKNLPTFGPFGPYLATADEIPDPQARKITLTMNGRVLQDGTTAAMLFGVAELIARLSRQTRLEPGDVIATGTPAGAAPARKPPTWIEPGAVLVVSVEGLGLLANPVVEGSPLDV